MRVVSQFAARVLIFVCLLVAGKAAHAEEKITIAAAADLKFALGEIVVLFKSTHPAAQRATIYGSSGKFSTQLRQDAPYDLYFSADIAYPRALKAEGFAGPEVQPYAVGCIVLWSRSRDAGKMTLADLADPSIRKLAIANPQHAPYGKRAEEALRAAGMWEKIKAKLVYGENVAQTAPHGSSISNILAVRISEIQDEGPDKVNVRMTAGDEHMLLSHITRRSRDQLGLAVGMGVFAQVKSVALMS